MFDFLNSYQTLIIEDLATITASPSAIYKQLNAVHQSEFNSNQRIVYYTQHLPSTELLDHIHTALETFKISGYFVLLCCKTDIDVSKYVDPITIITAIGIDSATLDTNFQLPNSFCPLPWMHLEMRHSGDIHPCCVSTDTVGQAATEDIKEILLGKKMHQLRQDFLSGQQPKGCDHCWKIERQGQVSNRQWHEKSYRKKFHLEFANDIQIRSLDIKPGNVCNFKCRICNSESSSLFADELRKFETEKTFKISQWAEYSDYMWEQLETLLPTIENLDFYGGEPFLVKKISALLKEAINRGYAKNIQLHFNSNGSIYPEELIELIKQFKSADIALSIDNIGARFELERGGQWDEIEQNIIKFAQLNNNKIHVHLWPTVNIQNIYYLDSVFSWAEQYSIDVNLNFLDGPSWASIPSLTPAAIELIANKYKNSLVPELQRLSNWVQSFAGTDGKDFITSMKKFDSRRNQNFLDTHPEIARAMGY